MLILKPGHLSAPEPIVIDHQIVERASRAINLRKPPQLNSCETLLATRRRSDTMMRASALREAEGNRYALLHCRDLGPVGLHISIAIRSNLADMTRAVRSSPDDLISRLGINMPFVDTQRLTRIEDLHTSGGGVPLDDPRHRNHAKECMQTHLKQYGAIKVGKRAMVQARLVPHARALCRKANLGYVPSRWNNTGRH
jgi:hypothetical protein